MWAPRFDLRAGSAVLHGADPRTRLKEMASLADRGRSCREMRPRSGGRCARAAAAPAHAAAVQPPSKFPQRGRGFWGSSSSPLGRGASLGGWWWWLTMTGRAFPSSRRVRANRNQGHSGAATQFRQRVGSVTRGAMRWKGGACGAVKAPTNVPGLGGSALHVCPSANCAMSRPPHGITPTSTLRARRGRSELIDGKRQRVLAFVLGTSQTWPSATLRDCRPAARPRGRGDRTCLAWQR